MLKKIAKYSIVLLASSSAAIYAQQPAQASFIDDLSAFLKGAEIGAELGEGVSNAIYSDGSVDVRQIIRSTRRAVDQVKQATEEESESQYQADDPDTSEIEESEIEEDIDEDSEPEGQYEDTSEY